MFNYSLYRFGQFIALRIPLNAVYALAVFFAEIHCFLSHKDREGVYSNLKIIFPGIDNRRARSIARNVFRNFAKYLVDFFRYSKIDGGFIESKVTVENRFYLDKALSGGKGAIVLTAHIGNWELGGAIIARMKYPFWAIAREHANSKVNAFFDRQRESMGIKVIPLASAVRKSLRALQQNALLALLGDRDFSQNGGIIVDFLGKKACLPAGPFFLSYKTGAPIIPGYLVRNGDDTFKLCFDEPISPPHGDDREKNRQYMVAEWARRLEAWIKKYPEQWYIFRKFWIE